MVAVFFLAYSKAATNAAFTAAGLPVALTLQLMGILLVME
jgi:hypothetical protein